MPNPSNRESRRVKMPPLDKKIRDDNRDTVTSFVDGNGHRVSCERHQPCNGNGCEECRYLGFLIERTIDMFDNLIPES